MKFFVNKLLRFIICGVCWDSDMIEFPYCCMKVSMPHAALYVSGYAMKISNINSWEFQCRTRHYVCRDKAAREEAMAEAEFQCRT